MKKAALAVLMTVVVPLMAAEPSEVVVWSGSELKGYGKKLAPKINEGKVASERLATLAFGGEVVSPKTTAPNEVRGPSIKGGERKPLAAGDVVHIPAKVPHQLLVPAGKEFTYFVMKVDTP